MEGLIDSLIDVNIVARQVQQTIVELSSVDKKIEELSKKAITLHFEVKKDNAMTELLAHMKEYSQIITVVSQKEQQRAIVSTQLATAEKQLSVSSKEVEDTVKAQIGTIEQNIAIQRKTISANKDLKKELEDLKGKYIELSRQYDELKSRRKEDTFAIEENIAKRKNLSTTMDGLRIQIESGKAALSDTNIMIRQQVKEMNAAGGSITALGIKLGQMKKAYREMTEEERNSPAGQALLRNIQQLDSKVKQLDASIGNHQRNVGNYQSAMSGLSGAVGGAMKILGAFGVSLGAVNVIKGTFNKTMQATNDIGDAYRVTMAQAKAAVDHFFTALASGDWSNFFEGLHKAVEAAREYDEIMDDLRDKNRSFKVYTSEQKAQAEKLKNDMRDRAKSDKERIAAGEKVIEIEKNILETRKELATREKEATFNWAVDTYGMEKASLEALVKTYHLREDEITQAKELFELEKNLQKERSGTDTHTRVDRLGPMTIFTVNAEKRKEAEDAYSDFYNKMSAEQLLFAEQFKKYGKITDDVRDKLVVSASKEYEAEKQYQTSISRANTMISQLRKSVSNERDAEIEKQRAALQKLNQLEVEGALEKIKVVMNDEKNSYEVRRAYTESYYSSIEKTAENTAKTELEKAGLLSNEIKAIEQKKTNDIEKAERDLKEALEKLDKDVLKRQADELKLKVDAAEKGSKEEMEARKELLENERQQEIKNAEKTGISIEEINSAYNAKILKNYSEFIDEKIKKSQKEAEERARIAQETAMTEEAPILEKYKKGEINRREYEKEVSDIRHKYSKEAIEYEIDNLQKLLDNEKLTEKQRTEINKKLSDAKKALSDEETKHEVDNIKKVEDARKKAIKMAQDLAKQAFDMAMDFLIQQSEAKIAEFDAELERIDERMDKELEWLDNAVMSDETRAAEEKRIKEQAKADSDKIEEEKRKEQQRQATYQKAASIVQAIINTAQGITAALTIPVAGIALAAVVGALGAAQIALIASQPTPKYAQGIYGDEEHPGGYAIVGDARKKEYVLTPDGKLYETPAVPTLVDMAEGSQVFPDYKTMMQYFRPEIPKYTTTSTGQYEFNDMKKEIVLAIRNNKATQQVHMNLDKNGIWYVANSKSGWKRHINNLTKGQQQ